MVPEAIHAHCHLFIAFAIGSYFCFAGVAFDLAVLGLNMAPSAKRQLLMKLSHIPVYFGRDTSPCSVTLSSLPRFLGLIGDAILEPSSPILILLKSLALQNFNKIAVGGWRYWLCSAWR